MRPLVNPKLDLDEARRTLDADGVAVVRNFFVRSFAQQVLLALESSTPWDLAYSSDGKGRLIPSALLKQMSQEQIRREVAPALAVSRESRSSFQFVYNTCIAPDPQAGAPRTGVLLYDLAAGFHEPDSLAFVRQLTGCADIVRMSVMAARYLPGHFLTLHDDVHEGERREVAYILNLSRDWLPEWGGLLHLCDGDLRTVLRTITPEFNTMVLLRPPMWHFVSQVASYAPAARYTVTGWMLGA